LLCKFCITGKEWGGVFSFKMKHFYSCMSI
jgi:hypothetical protein